MCGIIRLDQHATCYMFKLHAHAHAHVLVHVQLRATDSFTAPANNTKTLGIAMLAAARGVMHACVLTVVSPPEETWESALRTCVVRGSRVLRLDARPILLSLIHI